jgi:hypothetical protein
MSGFIWAGWVGASRSPVPSFGKVPGSRHQGHFAWRRLCRRAQSMSVSVATYQLRVLVVAVVGAVFGHLIVVSIGDGRAADVSFVAESRADVFTSALGDSAQPPVGSRVPVAASTVPAENEFVTGALFAGHRGPDDMLAMLADIYDDTRTSPMWPDSLPSPASLTPAELVRLLGIVGGVALGIYGLLAFNLRRRNDRRPTHHRRAHAP